MLLSKTTWWRKNLKGSPYDASPDESAAPVIGFPPLAASLPAYEFYWEEVATAPGPSAEPAEPEWEVLGDTPPRSPADADEGFVYTSDRDVHEVLVAGGEGLFLTSKPSAARLAVEALPSAVVAAVEEGEGEECAVYKDWVTAGEHIKRMPCSHRYHQD